METASAVFVPRSKRWWTNSRRRRSGYHFRVFRKNHSQIRLTFVKPFNSFLERFHHSCLRLEVQDRQDLFHLEKNCSFPFSWSSFCCLGIVFLFVLLGSAVPVEKLILLEANSFDLICTPFIRTLSRPLLRGHVLV